LHISSVFFFFQEIKTEDQREITNIDYHTKFILFRAARKDSGMYTIIAKNTSGEDRADVEILILGAPSKPNGPLAVSDVRKDGCKLKWKKPDDDGGSPIEYYEIEKMDLATGQWLPAGKSATPEADVTGLQEGKTYKFRVKAVN
jgi:hypothetical protein